MDIKNILHFLEELSENNNREWMDANKRWYQDTRKMFIGLVGDLISGIGAFDDGIAGLQAKDCIFRINRDIRFSPDKRPYKNNFGAYFSEGGRHSVSPGYYLHLQPGEHFLGGGIYMPEAEVLKKIRQEVDYNPEELKRIVEEPSFRETFGEITGEKLKTAPKGYPKDHPNIEFLKLKSYTVIHRFSDDEVLSPDFRDRVIEMFRLLFPFNQYLAVAVS